MPTAPVAELARPLPVSLRHLVRPDRPAPGLSGDVDRDRQFVAMLRAFRETGGLARGDEVAELLAQRQAGDVSRLARWIVAREVVAFDWRGELWVPLFQFHLADMALRPQVQQVARSLGGNLSPWDLALWFSTPNPRLQGQLPADVLGSEPLAVLAAAVGERPN